MKNRINSEDKIRKILAKMTPYDSLSALNNLSKEILRSIGNKQAIVEAPVYPRILNRKGTKSIIDKDSEMKDYILSLSEITTIAALRVDLISRFGEDRVPSKSSIHRFLIKLEGRD